MNKSAFLHNKLTSPSPGTVEQQIATSRIVQQMGTISGRVYLEIGFTDTYTLATLRQLGAASCMGVQDDFCCNEVMPRISPDRSIKMFQTGITDEFDLQRRFDGVILDHAAAMFYGKFALRNILRNATRHVATGGKLVICEPGPFFLCEESGDPAGKNTYIDATSEIVSFKRHPINQSEDTGFESFIVWPDHDIVSVLSDSDLALSQPQVSMISPTPAEAEQYPELTPWLKKPTMRLFVCYAKQDAVN